MGGDALVPEGLGDFRRVEFWDGFFATRGAKAFEWYGEWRQLRPLALALCRGRTILVPGCGNSSLSADMCAASRPHTHRRSSLWVGPHVVAPSDMPVAVVSSADCSTGMTMAATPSRTSTSRR